MLMSARSLPVSYQRASSGAACGEGLKRNMDGLCKGKPLHAAFT